MSGYPSNAFEEEKMMIAEMMKKIREISDAYPLLKDIDKRLREQKDTIHSHSVFLTSLVDKGEINTRFKMMGWELEHKMNDEFIKFKFKADEHMANMVSEDKFKQSLSKTVNLKDH